MSNSANKLNNRILFDKFFGLRAFGIVFYGILSSIFYLIGDPDIEKYKINEIAPLFIVILIYVFLFIRNRLQGFYLTTDFLNIRSFMITHITLSISTVIFGLFGLLQGKYVYAPHYWIEPNFEPFFSAIVSLTIGSTFFLIVVTKKIGLPALPPVQFVNLVTEIRSNIKLLKSDQIWKEYVSMEDDKLINLVKKTDDLLNQAINIKITFNLQKSLKPVHDDIINFINVLEDIAHNANAQSKKHTWEMYFAKITSLSSEQRICRERKNDICNSINRIKELKLED